MHAGIIITEDCQDTSVSSWLYNGYRIALYYYKPLLFGPSQIYQSVLRFIPECASDLVRTWSNEMEACVEVKDDKQNEWNSIMLRLSGHSNMVACVAFSPDGGQIVSASSDKTVAVWDARTGAHLKTLKSHSDYVTSVAFSSDGSWIVSGSDNETVAIWDVRTGAHLKILKGHSDYIRSVAFSPDGSQIVSGSNDRTVATWDARTGVHLKTLKGHSDYVVSVAFSPDGSQIVWQTRK
ncbi:hypothetical protein FRC03_005861 [Tulasnella sp. 419]|nr:hypothetical protein FRC03_005861 [Tulasnella sp. 419]